MKPQLLKLIILLIKICQTNCQSIKNNLNSTQTLPGTFFNIPGFYIERLDSGQELLQCHGSNISRLAIYPCTDRTQCENLLFLHVKDNQLTKLKNSDAVTGRPCALRQRCMEMNATIGLAECVTPLMKILHYITLRTDWHYEILTRKSRKVGLISTSLSRTQSSQEGVTNGDVLYEGEELKINCRLSKLFSKNKVYIFGLKQNGERIEIDSQSIQLNDNLRPATTMAIPSKIYFTNIEGPVVKINGDFVGYACAAEVIDHVDEWADHMILFTVQDGGKIPQIDKTDLRRRSILHGTENVDIHCNATGTPAPKIVWFLNGNEMSLSSYSTVNTQGNLTVSILRIHKMKRDSHYKCVAQNLFGNDTIDLDIDVYHPSKPKILNSRHSLERVSVTKNGNKSLLCTAIGMPTPEINWLHNGQDFLEHVTTLNGNKTESIVTWSVVTKKIEGNYTCKVQNEHGIVSKNFHVDFDLDDTPDRIKIEPPFSSQTRTRSLNKAPLNLEEMMRKMKSSMIAQSELTHGFYREMWTLLQQMEDMMYSHE